MSGTLGPVLDVRVYRAAFLPALVALFVAAFSLADRPAPARRRSAADAFDAERAFGGPTPLRNSLRSWPARSRTGAPARPTTPALADRVAETLARPDRTRGPGLPGHARARPATSRPWSACGPGLSSRRIVVVSHRDAAATRPALAELSGTAAMLELARLFRARELRKTLVLVSTSGATTGFTGARAWADAATTGGRSTR